MRENRSIKDPFTRRAFVTGAAKTFLGVGAMPLISGMASNALASGRPINKVAKAKSVIYLYMSGGMSHLDTFDTKPGAETQGPVESIKTSADGVQLSEYLPKLADQMHNVAVINSMNSTRCSRARSLLHAHQLLLARNCQASRHGRLGSQASWKD